MKNFFEIGKGGKYFTVTEEELIVIANKYIGEYYDMETVETVEKAIEFLEVYNNLSVHKLKRYKTYVDRVIDGLNSI